MPENTNPEIEKTDLQYVLDAINELAKTLAEEKTEIVEDEPEQVEAPITKEDVMGWIREVLAEELSKEEDNDEEEEDEPEPNVTYYYKAPVEEDFESPEEYQKALDEYNKLVTEIKESLPKPEVTQVSKSVEVVEDDKKELPDYDELFKAADHLSFDQLKAKMGVK
jgi:hypothetical protein